MPSAVAQACPGVCIGFAPVASGVQAVPLSPEAMGLLAVMIAAAGFWAMRRGAHRLMGLLLAAAAGSTGMVLEMRQAQAQATTYTVVLTAGSSSAQTTLPDVLPEFVVNVQNTLGIPVTITEITLKPALTLPQADAVTTGPLKVGSTLAAGSTATIVKLSCPPGTSSDGRGGCG